MNTQNLTESDLTTRAPNEVFFRYMLRIRRFEEKLLSEFSSGHFRGTTHTYIGQEANAVGILTGINHNDIVVSNHRSHGHFLAYGGDMTALFAELMGKKSGVCGGRGGSQHLHWKNFYSNGVLGGTSPIAVGLALGEKTKGSDSLTIIFLGDGALGEGVVYESLNMAALWNVPILFVLENNQIAQTTPIDQNLAGKIADRCKSFGILYEEINRIATKLLEQIRTNTSPLALIINTHRFGPHSKGDDTRPSQLIQYLRDKHDPISIHGGRIEANIRTEIEQQVGNEINEAYLSALEDG
jgi:TPP-dependent pyruvate/acetoin dehydrogenase alpha subunit